MNKIVLCFLLFLPLFGQESWELNLSVDQAISDQFYDQALQLIDQGKELYPLDPSFPTRAGELYMDKALYSLALEEFEKALSLVPTSYGRFKISQIHAYLDHNEESAAYLELLLEDPLYRKEALSDLGWIYFKLHRLREGEALMLASLDEEFDRSLAHTLGTIYSGLFEYEKSKEYYLLSIEDALSGGDSYFAAVAYYNLSLLEMTFYNYEKALEYTNLSIENFDRPSAHIAKGEILQLRLDFEGALAEYNLAESWDQQTPLALLDLSTLFREFGQLDRALVYVKRVRDFPDNSWMYYYGTNWEEWNRDITKIFMETYYGLAHSEALSPTFGLFEGTKSLFRRIKFNCLYYFYKGRFTKLSQKQGNYQLSQQNSLIGWDLLAKGAKGYKKTATHYLELARENEISLAPSSAPWYDWWIGYETHDPILLGRAQEGFISPWENSPRSMALIERVKGIQKWGVAPWEREEYNSQVNLLYSLNKGSLRQQGITLPLELEVQGEKARSFTSLFKRYHSLKKERSPGDWYRMTLIIEEEGSLIEEEGSLNWYLLSPQGEPLSEGRYETGDLSKSELIGLIGEMEEQIYGGL